jgi:hypothetical protein
MNNELVAVENGREMCEDAFRDETDYRGQLPCPEYIKWLEDHLVGEWSNK